MFRLISDHLVQKGSTFPQPLDMTIDAVKGDVVVRYTDDHGEQKTESEHLDVPPDLANGLILTLLKMSRGCRAEVSVVRRSDTEAAVGPAESVGRRW